MNVYFLVEGKRTEMIVYPKWLSALVPELVRVKSVDSVTQNNYYIFSGEGFPSLLIHLRNAIEDVNKMGKYHYLVLCLDTDEQNIEECKQEIFEFIKSERISLVTETKFEIVAQKKCFETWSLGNPKIFKKNPSDNFLRECVTFYNVKENDPELMGKLLHFEDSVSIFHSKYLQKLLAGKNVTYSKKNPQSIAERYFLCELVKRSEKTGHIPSFKYFVDFCREIRTKIT